MFDLKSEFGDIRDVLRVKIHQSLLRKLRARNADNDVVFRDARKVNWHVFKAVMKA